MIDEDRSQSIPEDSPEAVDATVETADISSEEAVPAVEPAVDSPAVEVQAAEESSDPVVEAPLAEEPVAEEPVAEEPAAEEPVAEEPAAEEPVPETPAVEPTPEASPLAESISDETDEDAFDPAVDMPMYRQGFDWFVLRVASNKENYVRDTLQKKVQIEQLETSVGRIMVPTEKTRTLKGGKARITETKLYPGYIFVEMQLDPAGRIPQDVFFLIKETTGVGDFVGTAGRPTPMSPDEVEKMLFDSRVPDEDPTVKLEFEKGDNVTINEGPFENYEGTVDEVMPDKGLVRVHVSIFGRQAPVELEYWQISKSDE